MTLVCICMYCTCDGICRALREGGGGERREVYTCRKREERGEEWEKKGVE